jgi:hypothetical protein
MVMSGYLCAFILLTKVVFISFDDKICHTLTKIVNSSAPQTNRFGKGTHLNLDLLK